LRNLGSWRSLPVQIENGNEVWTQERLAWASTPAVHSFATQPEFEDYAKLLEAFARQGARPA
jgi:hypothetical protein